MENSVKSIVAPYGIIMGLILALLTVLIYVFNLELFTRWWLNPLNLIIVLIIAIMAIKKAKSLKTKYFSFKDAFTAYFIPVVIGTLISGAVALVLFNVVDPEASEQLLELSIASAREMFEGFGMAEADIDTAMKEMEKNDPFSPLNYLMGYIFWLAFYAVIGLIIALIFREKNPSAA